MPDFSNIGGREDFLISHSPLALPHKPPVTHIIGTDYRAPRSSNPKRLLLKSSLMGNTEKCPSSTFSKFHIAENLHTSEINHILFLHRSLGWLATQAEVKAWDACQKQRPFKRSPCPRCVSFCPVMNVHSSFTVPMDSLSTTLPFYGTSDLHGEGNCLSLPGSMNVLIADRISKKIHIYLISRENQLINTHGIGGGAC